MEKSAGAGTWGWAVSIYIAPGYLCGGSILSSTWIVTAAHCVVNASASDIYVFAGSNVQWSGQVRNLSGLTVHPSYDPNTKQNDIALLSIRESTEYVRPECDIDLSAVDQLCGIGCRRMATGWSVCK